MQYNSDFRYDLKLGQLGEQELSKILYHKRIEVKKDFKAHQTGNVYIEYESRGKKSGIATTEAEYYAFILEGAIVIKATALLKQMCRKYLGTERDKLGGDNNTSKGILLPVQELLK